MRSAAQQGAVVGFAGEGKGLVDELGLHGQDRYGDLPDDTPVSYFANGTLDQVREGYTLSTSGVQLGESWTGVLNPMTART